MSEGTRSFDEIATLVMCMLGALMVGFAVAAMATSNNAYRMGQLDYQAGKIEWTMIDGKLHHIQEEKK